MEHAIDRCGLGLDGVKRNDGAVGETCAFAEGCGGYFFWCDATHVSESICIRCEIRMTVSSRNRVTYRRLMREMRRRKMRTTEE